MTLLLVQFERIGVSPEHFMFAYHVYIFLYTDVHFECAPYKNIHCALCATSYKNIVLLQSVYCKLEYGIGMLLLYVECLYPRYVIDTMYHTVFNTQRPLQGDFRRVASPEWKFPPSWNSKRPQNSPARCKISGQPPKKSGKPPATIIASQLYLVCVLCVLSPSLSRTLCATFWISS